MTPEEKAKSIRNLTRMALPSDDGYLFRLGVALYSFASLSSFMTEIASHLDPNIDRTELQAKTGGEILNAFRSCLKNAKKDIPAIASPGQAAADLFQTLNSERSDIVHAYPITNGSGAQILHRRLDSKGKYFEVTNDFLDSFISRLHNVSSDLHAIRKIVKPELGD
ncbi:hypothetical protein [Stenotrophomonas maltophilia]|uniref:hypothetical protein n=1 Tax=Stenotrophomonas maltophilia TaxID=40324 RepID=UPI0012B0A19D|nr:hypothetical protein [Stenotrophomonas maltophilia]QGM04817.1 hypothetical protein FEO88_07825 [Stenotrophomonas maltophilia]